MVTTDALKLLYKKLGGTADVDNITAISDMVDLIEDVAGGGGGGASGLVVHVTRLFDGEQPIGMSLDKNYNEIKTALLSGSYVTFVEDSSDETGEYYDFSNIDSINTDTETGKYYVTESNIEFEADSATGVLTATF